MAGLGHKFGNRDQKPLPQKRLLTLLQQAIAYQMEFGRHHPKVVPQVTSFVSDYSPMVLPNALHKNYIGHKANVKCLTFVGEQVKNLPWCLVCVWWSSGLVVWWSGGLVCVSRPEQANANSHERSF